MPNIFKALLRVYVRGLIYLKATYTAVVLEVMTEQAEQERKRIEAAREAAWQERKAKQREEQTQSSGSA